MLSEECFECKTKITTLKMQTNCTGKDKDESVYFSILLDLYLKFKNVIKIKRRILILKIMYEENSYKFFTHFID